jgi:hypothetical protein
VLVCHRRFGKTVAMVNQLIDSALRFEGCRTESGEEKRNDGRFGYVAPFLKQAKEVTWDILRKPVDEAIYCNTTIKEYLHKQALQANSNTFIRVSEVDGEEKISFLGMPIREADAILNTEAQIS